MPRLVANKPERPVLIYDGNCPVCSRTVEWVRENQRPDAFEMLPCQSADLDERFPEVRRSACMRALHVVLPDGSVLAGELALPEIFKRTRRYAPVAALFSLPGTQPIARAFYQWFAERRYSIADLFFSKQDRGKKKISRGKEEERTKKN